MNELEKLSPELWYKIWEKSGVKPHQLVIYAQVCRYFRSLADGHLEWTQICNTAQLKNFIKNPKRAVMKNQRKLCSDCYVAVKNPKSCQVDDVSKLQCHDCWVNGMEERVKMVKAAPNQIYGIDFFPFTAFALGTDKSLTLDRVVYLYSTIDERKQELLSYDNQVNLRDKHLLQYCFGAKDRLSACLYVNFIKKTREQLSTRKAEIRRMLDIESVVTVEELIKSNTEVKMYVEEGSGNPRHLFRKLKCSDHIERKDTLTAELARYGLKFNKKNEICDNFVESGTQSMLSFIVSLMREFDWCSRKPNNPKSKSSEYNEFYSNQLASFEIEKNNAVTRYVKFMCSDSRDFTLPRFMKLGPGVPPPSLWSIIESKYHNRIVRALSDLHKQPAITPSSIKDIWTRIDQMIGNEAAQTIKYFLVINEELPEFVEVFNHETVQQLILALTHCKPKPK